MSKIITVVVALLAAGLAESSPQSSDTNSLSEGPIFYTDAGACAARGGLCTLASDCPQRVEGAEEGLCGPREDRTCCQTLPSSLTSCSRRGGECTPAEVCGNAPVDAVGDCSTEGHVCCVWV